MMATSNCKQKFGATLKARIGEDEIGVQSGILIEQRLQ